MDPRLPPIVIERRELVEAVSKGYVRGFWQGALAGLTAAAALAIACWSLTR